MGDGLENEVTLAWASLGKDPSIGYTFNETPTGYLFQPLALVGNKWQPEGEVIPWDRP